MPLNNEEALTEERPSTATVGACGHDIPPVMREYLGRSAGCPSCTIDYRIADIRKIQADLRRRDGIFASKTNPESRGGIKHKDYTRSWIKIKIHCFQDIQKLENLQRDFLEQAEEWGVMKALEKWEQFQDKAARVPGYKYVQGSFQKSKEEEGAVLLPRPKEDRKSNLDVGTSTPLTPQERSDLLEQDREWHVVTRKRKAKKRRVVDLTEGVETLSEELSSTQISDAASPDDEIFKEMDDVKKRLDQRSAMGSFDLFDAFTGSEFSTIQKIVGCEAPHNESTTSPTPSSPAPTSSTPSPTPPSPNPTSVARLSVVQPGRSALKGTRSTPLTSRATFANHTTILGSSNPSSTEKPHNKHTIARFAHKRGTFHRGKQFYRPGTWSSPEGLKKKNTSFMSMSWPSYEERLRGPPTVNKNRVFMEVEDIDTKPTFESEVTKLMNKARDRKLAVREDDEKDAANATPATKIFEMFEIKMKTEKSGAFTHSTVTDIEEGGTSISKQLVTTPATNVFETKIETDRHDVDIPSSVSNIGEHTPLDKQQVNDIASEARRSTPPPVVTEGKTKGRKAKKPTSSKMITTEWKRNRMREDQKTSKDPNVDE